MSVAYCIATLTSGKRISKVPYGWSRILSSTRKGKIRISRSFCGGDNLVPMRQWLKSLNIVALENKSSQSKIEKLYKSELRGTIVLFCNNKTGKIFNNYY